MEFIRNKHHVKSIWPAYSFNRLAFVSPRLSIASQSIPFYPLEGRLWFAFDIGWTIDDTDGRLFKRKSFVGCWKNCTFSLVHVVSQQVKGILSGVDWISGTTRTIRSSPSCFIPRRIIPILREILKRASRDDVVDRFDSRVTSFRFSRKKGDGAVRK